MIRVLHSELESNIGGIESFLLNITKAMDRTDIQFDMLMRGKNKYLEKTLSELGVNIYHVPSNPVAYIKYVKNLLKNGNYDFVHVHKNSAANIVLPIMVKRYTNAKLIVHSHNTNPSSGSKLAIMLHKMNRNRLIKLSDYRFACSDTAAGWMYGDDYQNKDVHIIKNGIIAKDYVYNPQIRDKVREQLGLKDKFVIGHVGAFRKQKNHQFLLDLFSKLEIPNAVLMLIGDGDLRPEIQEKVEQLGLTDKVLFLGSRHDVADLLQACDVFVMPSLWEGLSVAAIEAQASGLPLLLSKNVSKQVHLTDNVKFLSLNNMDKWLEELKNINSSFIRKNTVRKISDTGYDISISAERLKNLYLQDINFKV